MKTNQAGVDLIRRFEGVRLQAYRCPAGVPTIGYGHTGSDVKMGQQITEAEADELLRHDLKFFEDGIDKCLGGAETTENQFSAMVCLAFNIGLSAFKSSSVLRFHREQRPNAAAQSFNLWNKGGGKVLKGLVDRRNAESQLYLTN